MGDTNDDKPVARDAEASPDARAPYKVICISLYNTDLAALAVMVAELKRRGITRANKSWLIRLALSRLDLDTITQADRP
jgi:hypothetical protein